MINIYLGGGINLVKFSEFFKLGAIVNGIYHDEISAGFLEAILRLLSCGAGNHSQGAHFSRFSHVVIALEIAAGKRVFVALHEKEFDPAVSADVVMIF